MDTISKHHKRLTKPYVQSPGSAEIVRSAKNLARLILASDLIIDRHKKKILSDVLWLISEADGKYTTRFRSAEVIRLAKEEPNSDIKIQHEHVFQRKKIKEEILHRKKELLANPSLLDEILDRTVGCVVTETEHKNLPGCQCGWSRYTARVRVLDMSESPPVERGE